MSTSPRRSPAKKSTATKRRPARGNEPAAVVFDEPQIKEPEPISAPEPKPARKPPTPHGEAVAPDTHMAVQIDDDLKLVDVVPFGIRRADLDAAKDHAIAYARHGWTVATVPSGTTVVEHLREKGAVL